jgi:hypothetical protein
MEVFSNLPVTRYMLAVFFIWALTRIVDDASGIGRQLQFFAWPLYQLILSVSVAFFGIRCFSCHSRLIDIALLLDIIEVRLTTETYDIHVTC